MAKNKKDGVDSFSGMFSGMVDEEISVIQPVPTGKKRGAKAKVGEKKTNKTFCLIPSTYEKAGRVAYIKRESLSAVVNRALEQYIADNQELLEKYD